MINALIRSFCIAFNIPRPLTLAELTEIQELSRIAMAERFKADRFEKNTGLLNAEGVSGKAVAEQQKRIADLMEGVKDERVNAILATLGYQGQTRVTIDLHSGKITKV